MRPKARWQGLLPRLAIVAVVWLLALPLFGNLGAALPAGAVGFAIVGLDRAGVWRADGRPRRGRLAASAALTATVALLFTRVLVR